MGRKTKGLGERRLRLLAVEVLLGDIRLQWMNCVLNFKVWIISDVCVNSLKQSCQHTAKAETEDRCKSPFREMVETPHCKAAQPLLVLCSHQVILESSSHHQYLPKPNGVLTTPRGVSRVSTSRHSVWKIKRIYPQSLMPV